MDPQTDPTPTAEGIELQTSPISNTPRKPLFFTERPSTSPTAPTLLLLHGLYSSHLEFAQLPIPSTSYHILTPDIPGHSSSSHLPVSLENTTTLLVNLIKSHAHSSRAHIVGVSYGAYLALHIAATHPELVDSVFATGCSLPTSAFLGNLAWMANVPLLYFPNVVNYALSWYGGTISPELLKEMHANATLALGNAVYASLKEWELKPISVRVCLCASGKGDLVRPLWGMEKKVKEGNAGSRAVVAKGKILAWDIQAPEDFAEALMAWAEGRELPGFLVSLEKWFSWGW
ncbi:alpha/beta-hydrolase [Choiromyces venosus 120613-1]|uniref:Alpha/beta-hydrolase n=1 Tax=Choiromyces venosus 120613-1 TaxID=1336337 RepID=A0A3N4JF58_9PEZI|nr:alpha/beta-hydrolase [Choiromyces venosus 120613-1]